MPYDQARTAGIHGKRSGKSEGNGSVWSLHQSNSTLLGSEVHGINGISVLLSSLNSAPWASIRFVYLLFSNNGIIHSDYASFVQVIREWLEIEIHWYMTKSKCRGVIATCKNESSKLIRVYAIRKTNLVLTYNIYSIHEYSFKNAKSLERTNFARGTRLF